MCQNAEVMHGQKKVGNACFKRLSACKVFWAGPALTDATNAAALGPAPLGARTVVAILVVHFYQVTS